MIDLALANPREESLRKASNDYFAAQLACERALATDAKVTLAQGPAVEVLAEHEGVAALLRW